MNWKSLGREVGLYIIAIVVVLATFWALNELLGKPLPVGSENAVMLILGVLVSKFGTIVDYFFGSSKGSADKTDTLSRP